MALTFPGSPTVGQIYVYGSDTYEFDGKRWRVKVTAGSGGGGGSLAGAFYEGDITLTESHTITTGKNAMTAGPITVADGVVITIPDGSTWTIV